jgi:spermidine synthase
LPSAADARPADGAAGGGDLTSVPRAAASRHRLALALMVASGFAALGYQIVWTQQAALWLGHEAAAVLAVVAAFFGGIGVGALALGARIERSAQPARWYAASEAIIGGWCLALAWLMAPVANGLLVVIGPQPAPAWHWCVAFGGTFLLLLPATAAMGATLPAMERVLADLYRRETPIAALYAGNTFGAVAGVLAAAFWLVPEIGLLHTTFVCAALNFLCAGLATALTDPTTAPVRAVARARGAGTLFVLAATGFLGIGYEVLVVRVLSQVAENTVYTFALLLAVYLVGTAAGAAAYAGRRWTEQRTAIVRDRLLRMLAGACLLGVLGMALAPVIKAAILRILGPGFPIALGAEAALAVVAFLLPTIAMGALFSHLATAARRQGIGFGRALGVNTLGAACAPLVFGVLLVAGVGAKAAMLVVVAGYLALTSRAAWRRPAQWAAVVATLLIAVLGPTLTIIDVPQGGRVVRHDEGVMATVSIVEDRAGIATLHINNRQQEGSSATVFADARQAILPLLLHPAPRHALFLGLGTGVTAFAAADDLALDVDAVELLPEVITASDHFTAPLGDDGRRHRLHVVNADARRFVRASGSRYDVIVADNFHPARSGSGALYTVEHFAAVRARLAADGVFCQWLPLHQLDLPTLRSIVRSFLAVFPHGGAMLATNSLDTPVLGLVARNGAEGFSPEALRARLGGARMSVTPAEYGIPDDLALLGTFVAGPAALARFAGDAPINTDDRPTVAYLAPRVTYAPDSLPRDRLIAFLHEVSLAPDELLAAPGDAAWRARLAAYWSARDRFIEAGRDVQPTADVRRMLAQVRGPLLATLERSPDFRPAYDPLLRMAIALTRVDPVEARALLTSLATLQPERPEAMQALKELALRMP